MLLQFFSKSFILNLLPDIAWKKKSILKNNFLVFKKEINSTLVQNFITFFVHTRKIKEKSRKKKEG